MVIPLPTPSLRIPTAVACAITAFSPGAQETDEAQLPTATELQQVPAEAQPQPPVAALISAREELQDFVYGLGDIDTDSFLGDLESRAALLRERLQPISEVSGNSALGQLTLGDLLDLEAEVRADVADLAALAETLNERATLRDTQLDELATRRDNWERLTAAAADRAAPTEIMALAAEAGTLLDDTESALRNDRDAVLRTAGSIAALRMDATAFGREIRDRRRGLESASQRASGIPLWSPQLRPSTGMITDTFAALRSYADSIRLYLIESFVPVALWFLAVGGATLWLLRASGVKVSEFMGSSAATSPPTAVFGKPRSAALLTALLAVLIMSPAAPVAFTDSIVALLPLPAAVLATTVFAQRLRWSVYTLAGTLSVLATEPFYSSVPLVSRAVAVLVTLAVGIAFYADLRRGNWARTFASLRADRVDLCIGLICAVLIGLVVVDAIGFVGIATTLRTLILGGLGYGLVYVALAFVLQGLTLAALQVRLIASLAIVAQRPWAIIRFFRKFIDIVMAGAWLVSTLALSGLGGRTGEWLTALLSQEFMLGAVTIGVGPVLAAIVVVWLAWSISRFITFVRQCRQLGNRGSDSGLSFAISKVLQYAIIVAGFLLALSAMGFDLTRVTVLAGALGVGIGLGLQNIANNFISGLILLFERPIKVNDIAKIEETIGTVKEVGIRSTVVQTFDGAEVIVPNADLMSKTVVNWTKSNRRRRAEIDVGVAYGSDPGAVIGILDDVAQSSNDVLADPQPQATFTGFGDNSLNFRLYVWLADLSNMLSTPSALRQQILHRLEDAGIEIPFPQRDIRVTMAADAGDVGQHLPIAPHHGPAAGSA
jgi:small-conductance mechanosensitive channel